MTLFIYPLPPTYNNFILENKHKTILSSYQTEDLLYHFRYHQKKESKTMTSQTSTPTLTGSTSASSADNAPTYRSSMTESWNYTEMLAGNGLLPSIFSFLPPLPSTSLTHALSQETSPSHFCPNVHVLLGTAIPRLIHNITRRPRMRGR